MHGNWGGKIIMHSFIGEVKISVQGYWHCPSYLLMKTENLLCLRHNIIKFFCFGPRLMLLNVVYIFIPNHTIQIWRWHVKCKTVLIRMIANFTEKDWCGLSLTDWKVMLYTLNFILNVCFLLKHNIGDCVVHLDWSNQTVLFWWCPDMV